MRRMMTLFWTIMAWRRNKRGHKELVAMELETKRKKLTKVGLHRTHRIGTYSRTRTSASNTKREKRLQSFRMSLFQTSQRMMTHTRHSEDCWVS